MRIIHLSDLHFGRHQPELSDSLAAEIAGQAPDLVVVSGDFVQTGRPSEFRAARAFLKGIATPVFAVPGNHDLPAHALLLRFMDPYRRYRRHVAREIEPTLLVGDVAIAGINTARRVRLGLNWAEGAINRGQLDKLEERFAALPPHRVRIVVAHHPLVLPETAQAMKTVKRAKLALKEFARLGVRLVLSGHFHRSYVASHAMPVPIGEAVSLEKPLPKAPPMLLAQAATAISTRLRGEGNAYNLVEIGESGITIGVREWSGEGWRLRGEASAAV